MNKKIRNKSEDLKKKLSFKKGNLKSNKPEIGYSDYKLGFLIHNARINKGLTQKQLAEKCGTSRAYISKIENNIKGVRVSALRKIVETGLDGHLNLSVML